MDSEFSKSFIRHTPGAGISAYPVREKGLPDRKKLLIGKTLHRTRSFTRAHRIYINDQFSPNVSDGVYTWVILINYDVGDDMVFIASRAYNELEIYAKHYIMIERYIEAYHLPSHSDIAIVCSGEIKKSGRTVTFNFASGTYMADRSRDYDVRYAEITTDTLKRLGFRDIVYNPDFSTMIPYLSTEKEITSYLRNIPGGIQYYVVETDIANKISPLYIARLQTQLQTAERLQQRAPNSEAIQKQISELRYKIDEARSLQKKYKLDGKGKVNRKSKSRSKRVKRSGRKSRSRRRVTKKSKSRRKIGSRRRRM